jgi:hypothetical protein
MRSFSSVGRRLAGVKLRRMGHLYHGACGRASMIFYHPRILSTARVILWLHTLRFEHYMTNCETMNQLLNTGRVCIFFDICKYTGKVEWGQLMYHTVILSVHLPKSSEERA